MHARPGDPAGRAGGHGGRGPGGRAGRVPGGGEAGGEPLAVCEPAGETGGGSGEGCGVRMGGLGLLGREERDEVRSSRSCRRGVREIVCH